MAESALPANVPEQTRLCDKFYNKRGCAWSALGTSTGQLKHRKVFELEVSISRVMTLNHGGKNLEQETWMVSVLVDSRALREQSSSHGGYPLQ